VCGHNEKLFPTIVNGYEEVGLVSIVVAGWYKRENQAVHINILVMGIWSR